MEGVGETDSQADPGPSYPERLSLSEHGESDL